MGFYSAWPQVSLFVQVQELSNPPGCEAFGFACPFVYYAHDEEHCLGNI